MPVVIRTPRINNNDDLVRFCQILAPPGTALKKGDPVAELETDKATFTIESETDGYVLKYAQPLGEMIAVGSVLVWIGQTPDELIQTEESTEAPVESSGSAVVAEPSLKAAILVAKFGLSAREIPTRGDRLSAQDVLDYMQSWKLSAAPRQSAPITTETLPDLAPGERRPLSVTERGMLQTVLWHRDSAVPGYVEIMYQTKPWEEYAKAFQDRYNLLLSPLLSLMAHSLVRLAIDSPKLNSTIVADQLHHYANVNLGFTLQSGSNLYLLSVKEAEKLDEKAFVDAFGDITRHGMKGKVPPEETGNVTVSFSSMSRWQVSRHLPVLPPYTSLMIAHAHEVDGTAYLGATYDHRVLTGGDVAVVLRKLSRPPEEDEVNESSR